MNKRNEESVIAAEYFEITKVYSIIKVKPLNENIIKTIIYNY